MKGVPFWVRLLAHDFFTVSLIFFLEGCQGSWVVEISDSWNDGYENIFIFDVDGDVIGLLPPLITIFDYSLHEADNIFINSSQRKVSQKYIDILSKNFRKLRYFLPFPISAFFFTLFIPFSFGFANFVQSPLSTFDSHIMAFVVATVPLFFLRKEIR